jgi:hypothetical protein
MAVYHTNTGKLHPSDTRLVVEKRSGRTGVDPLMDEMFVLWQGEVLVGEPPNNFTGAFGLGRCRQYG